MRGGSGAGAQAKQAGFEGQQKRQQTHVQRGLVAEAAFLAGLPNAPARLNPYRNLDGALARQRRILDQMREREAISDGPLLVKSLALSRTWFAMSAMVDD